MIGHESELEHVEATTPLGNSTYDSAELWQGLDDRPTQRHRIESASCRLRRVFTRYGRLA